IGRDVRKDRAAQRFHLRDLAAALRTERQMGRDDQRQRLVARARDMRQQHIVARMMVDAHGTPPIARRMRTMARRSRDLTVPSGRPSSLAISLCGLSAKKDIWTTWACSGENVLSASANFPP